MVINCSKSEVCKLKEMLNWNFLFIFQPNSLVCLYACIKTGVPVRAINRPGSQLLGANGRDDGPIVSFFLFEKTTSVAVWLFQISNFDKFCWLCALFYCMLGLIKWHRAINPKSLLYFDIVFLYWSYSFVLLMIYPSSSSVFMVNTFFQLLVGSNDFLSSFCLLLSDHALHQRWN